MKDPELEIKKKINDSYEIPNNVVESAPYPLVSIRTSAYNHSAYIRQCIEGVLSQKTSFPIEYIIGEDYSSDGTREIVFEYAQKYPNIIRVVTADYNVGMSANGRRCIEKCRGKYMAICEGDDYWIDPYKLQKQVDFLESNPEYGMCYTKAKIYNQKHKRFNGNCGSKFIDYDNLLISNTIPTLTTLYRSSIYQKYNEIIQPNKKGWKTGDYPMWLWFGATSKIFFLDEETAVYRYLPESASHSIDVNKMEQFFHSALDIRMFYANKFAPKTNLINKFIDIYYSKIAHLGLITNNRLYYLHNLSKITNPNINTRIKYYAAKSTLLFYILRQIYITFKNI